MSSQKTVWLVSTNIGTCEWDGCIPWTEYKVTAFSTQEKAQEFCKQKSGLHELIKEVIIDEPTSNLDVGENPNF